MAIKRKTKRNVIPLQPVEFYDPARDGVTFGLLDTWQTCREKARLFLDGWSTTQTSFALLYGGMTHRILQNAYTAHMKNELTRHPDADWVAHQLTVIEQAWKRDNPTPHVKAEEMFHEALMKHQAVMPEYFRYWANDFNPEHRQWLEIEGTFQLPWTVKTRQGKTLTTFLRGRLDGAFTLSGKATRGRARLLETKTRTDIDEELMIDTMPHERQLTTYLSVLRKKLGTTPAGAQLNIIRKPQLRQSKREDWKQFAQRIAADVRQRPEWYFVRMSMVIDDQDINRSEADLNDLISDFLLWRAGESGHYKNTKMCVYYKRPCDFVKVCSHGDYTGLVKRPVVFRELEDE